MSLLRACAGSPLLCLVQCARGMCVRLSEAIPPAVRTRHLVRTVLWLGAHKTGTTFLQKSLDLSQDVLRSSGVFYMELNEFRDKYSRPLLNEDDARPAPSEFGLAGTRLNLIFDENIAGYVQHALRPKRFYPKATQRADRVLQHLGLVPDEIVFGVRSYDGYLSSLYCETLKSTTFKTFDEFLVQSFGRSRRCRAAPSVEEFGNMDWPSLLARLERHYRPARVRVYFHDQLRGHETALLSMVTSTPASGFRLLHGEERTGFSARAVQRLHEINHEREVKFEDVRRAVREYPRGPEQPAFDPFGEAEQAFLTQRYRHDVTRIHDEANLEVIDLT